MSNALMINKMPITRNPAEVQQQPLFREIPGITDEIKEAMSKDDWLFGGSKEHEQTLLLFFHRGPIGDLEVITITVSL